MSEPKFTRGPWNVHPAYPIEEEWMYIDVGVGGIWEFQNWSSVVAAGEKIIAVVQARKFKVERVGFPTVEDIEEARANLVLIVAAPMMLAALKIALPLLQEERAVCERSFLPDPSADEQEMLENLEAAQVAVRCAIDAAEGIDSNAELKTTPVKSVDCQMGDHANCDGEERKCNCECHEVEALPEDEVFL